VKLSVLYEITTSGGIAMAPGGYTILGKKHSSDPEIFKKEKERWYLPNQDLTQKAIDLMKIKKRKSRNLSEQ